MQNEINTTNFMYWIPKIYMTSNATNRRAVFYQLNYILTHSGPCPIIYLFVSLPIQSFSHFNWILTEFLILNFKIQSTIIFLLAVDKLSSSRFLICTKAFFSSFIPHLTLWTCFIGVLAIYDLKQKL